MSGPLSQQDLDALVQQHGPASRSRVRRVIAGKASEVGTLFCKEVIEIDTPDGVETVELYASTTCDFGHLLGTNGAEVAARCSMCGALVCTHAGCASMCVAGHPLCGKHTNRLGDQAYCRWHLLLALAGLGVRITGRGVLVIVRFLFRQVRGYVPFS